MNAADLDLLIEAAREAGACALELRDRGLSIQRKAGGSPVTNGDLEVDRLLAERLRGARPDYGWLSEESVDDPARLAATRVFIVDPIDGTSAYFRAKPWWTVAVSVVAARGGGATLNGAPIRAGSRAAVADCAMLAPMDTFSDPRWAAHPLGAWPPMRVERRNALTLRLALVGAGAFDAAVSLGPKHDWDLAPGAVIAEEAGALATDRLGAPLRFNTPRASSRSVVCANPALHRLLIDRVEGIDLAD